MPPPRRLTALWRSTHRSLAVQTPTCGRTLTTATPALQPRPRPRFVLAREPRASAAVRFFADDTTPRDVSGQSPAATADDGLLSTLRPTEQEPLRQEEDDAAPAENQEVLDRLELLARGLDPFDVTVEGHKFGLTTGTARPTVLTGDEDADQKLPQAGKLQDRYDPVTAQLTRLLMRDGKLAKAQRDMAAILNYLRTSPPPQLSPARPLLAGHPPAAQLPLDPVLYLTLAIDSVAPIIKIRNLAGLAGGGRALPVPVPLAVRQRRRTAFMWLLEIVNKKPSRGSGRNMLAHRIGEEIVAIVEGRSSLWDKRQILHKQGTSARANVNAMKK